MSTVKSIFLQHLNGTTPNATLAGGVSALIYLNGSTDYVELWGYNGTAGATNTQVGQPYTWMTGFLARSA